MITQLQTSVSVPRVSGPAVQPTRAGVEVLAAPVAMGLVQRGKEGLDS